MAIQLQDLMNAAQNAGEGEQAGIEAVAALLAEAEADPDTDTDELLKAAVAEFKDLQDNGEASEARAAALESLADVVDGIKADQARTEESRAALEERTAALSKRVLGDEDNAEGEDDPDAPPAEVQGDADAVTDAPAGDAPAEEEEEADAAALAASAGAVRRRKTKVNLATLPRRAPARVSDPTPGLSITASGNIPGFEMGQKLEGIQSLAAAATARLEGFPKTRIPNGFIRSGIAQIRTEYPKELVASEQGEDMQVLEYAADQKRLSSSKGKGSLLAAGGWCSPSETLYELAGELEDGNAGLVNLPDIQTPRGGVRTTEGPDFAALYTATGFQQTEAQAIAGQEKPFYRVPCTDFVDTRAEVVGLGIISGVLNDDAYPELTERVVRGALAAHNHRYNAATIKKMVAQANVTVTANVGASAATSLLNTVELQIIDYRYRYRANESLLLEVLAPIWVKGVIRSDLALRTGVELVQVTDQQIEAFFAARGAKIQFVYDWQDAFANNTPTAGFGNSNAATAWPTTVDLLIYAAGTYVRGRGDILTLDGIYDSTNIKTNDFVRLFTEEKLLVLRRQYQARRLSVALATNGLTGAPALLTAQGNERPVTP